LSKVCASEKWFSFLRFDFIWFFVFLVIDAAKVSGWLQAQNEKPVNGSFSPANGRLSDL
jgi:hypothetical protein